MENKKTVGWVVGGIVVAVVVVYLAVSGGLKLGGPGTEGYNGEQTDKGLVAAPGASPVATSGQVVTQEGNPVKLNVEPMSPEAPQQSAPITESQVPSSAVKITVSAQGFTPNTFTVKAGAPIALSVTSGDEQTHIFKFEDPSLSAVAVGIGPHETRLIPFNAPAKGEYTFYCDVPGHKTRGETGTMIVN